MQTQRPLNSNIARDGAPKRTVEAQPVKGQVRQSAPSHEYQHGAPLNDEPNTRLRSHEKPIAVHPGMTDRQRAALDPVANDPNAILQDAARLGRNPEKA